jgi:hypothetical protein
MLCDIKTDTDSVQNAIAAAQKFLIQARHREGYWQDFQLAAGCSDEWVTAYVGTALASLNAPQTTAVAFQAWCWLTSRMRSSPGWGYNAIAPRDADSTLWALQLAAAVGCSHWHQAHQGKIFLEQHWLAGGGCTTYASDTAIRRFTNAPPEQSFQGWCSAHTCVTAAVALLPSFCHPASNWLQQTQQEDGSWPSYWWCEREYATALAATALQKRKASARLQKAVQWGLYRINDRGTVPSYLHPTGSAFATAWVVRLLLLAETPLVWLPLQRAVRWLLEQQQADGSWLPAAGLRVPPPALCDPDRFSAWQRYGLVEGSITVDRRCLFTTATVMQALWQYKQIFQANLEFLN